MSVYVEILFSLFVLGGKEGHMWFMQGLGEYSVRIWCTHNYIDYGDLQRHEMQSAPCPSFHRNHVTMYVQSWQLQVDQTVTGNLRLVLTPYFGQGLAAAHLTQNYRHPVSKMAVRDQVAGHKSPQ